MLKEEQFKSKRVKKCSGQSSSDKQKTIKYRQTDLHGEHRSPGMSFLSGTYGANFFVLGTSTENSIKLAELGCVFSNASKMLLLFHVPQSTTLQVSDVMGVLSRNYLLV